MPLADRLVLDVIVDDEIQLLAGETVVLGEHGVGFDEGRAGRQALTISTRAE